MINIKEILKPYKRILITGGAGFIGGALIREILLNSSSVIFNIDNLSYASDLTGIKKIDPHNKRHFHLNIDLRDKIQTIEAIKRSQPDIVFHLAAESHVDRSIESPEKFLMTNVVGTYNLLASLLDYWKSLPIERKKLFRLHHISTDEVYGSLGKFGRFNELTPYDPRSPYSASKASSDHFVKAWFHTYGLPIIITNCSNNFGPYQFPEKLIPLAILKAIKGERIPLYGDGKNIRDWLFVKDHINAILLAATSNKIGESYCIGGYGEKTNKEVINKICMILDKILPRKEKYESLITYVKDRQGHDRRYAINSSKIKKDLEWSPNHTFDKGLEITVKWYLKNIEWSKKVLEKSGYDGSRIG